MKSYFFKFVVWQIWAIADDYIFFAKDQAIFAAIFFLIGDLLCLSVYVIRKKRGDDIWASLEGTFDIIPYKWWGIGAFVEAICWIHWEECSAVCLFLLATVLLGYIFDTMDRYKVWKKKHKKSNFCS